MQTYRQIDKQTTTITYSPRRM